MRFKTLQITCDGLDRIESAHSLDALNQGMEQIVRPFGFRRFGLMERRPTGDWPFVVLIGNYDEPWLAAYREGGYFEHDPIVPLATRRMTAFTWESLDRKRLGAKALATFALAEAFGLRDGLVAPWRSSGAAGWVTLAATDRLDLSPAERAALNAACLYFSERARTLFGVEPRANDCPLTMRQLDCLAWAAEGKTDWEISQILSISEGTVARHFQHARERLQVPTRIQAIVIAIHRRWLPLNGWASRQTQDPA